MAKKLVELELTESSLVDVPANPGAKLTLFKRGTPEAKADDVTPVVKTVGDDDTPKAALKRAFGMIAKALGMGDDVDIDLKGSDEPVATDVEEVVETVENLAETDLEKAELQKRLEDLEKRAKDAEELAKAERDKRVEAEFVKRAEGYGTLPESPETLGPIMKRASENKLTEDDFEKLEAVLKAAGEALDKSNLFKSLGVDGDGDTSAKGQLDAAIAKMQEANPGMTYEAAYVEAFGSLPADVQAKLM